MGRVTLLIAANSRAISCVSRLPKLPRTGTSLALLSATLNEIGFPGWPDPNLDSGSGFWGVNSKQGACTSPLFSFLLISRPADLPPSFIPHRDKEEIPPAHSVQNSTK